MSALIGYLASALMLGTFGARTMMPLRIIALASNVAFLAYGLLERYYLIVALQLLLLPVNLWRLIEILRLVRSLRAGIDETTVFKALLPFSKRMKTRLGEVIIRKGDPSDALYLVVEGSLWVEEAGAELGPGSIVGEIGVLSGTHLRTATVTARTDCVLARVSAKDFQRVYYTNPSLGLSLVRLIIDRLIQQVEMRRLAGAEAPV